MRIERLIGRGGELRTEALIALSPHRDWENGGRSVFDTQRHSYKMAAQVASLLPNILELGFDADVGAYHEWSEVDRHRRRNGASNKGETNEGSLDSQRRRDSP